jgi:hypothetical protein
MVAGYALSCGACDEALYDRIVLGATDASLVWAVWRGATLNARVLQCGAGGLMGQSRGAEAEAAAALAALSWGASGQWLAAAVDAQVGPAGFPALCSLMPWGHRFPRRVARVHADTPALAVALHADYQGAAGRKQRHALCVRRLPGLCSAGLHAARSSC